MSYQDILGITIAEIVGDFGFQYFANKGGIVYFSTGFVGYVGVVYFLIRALQGSTILLVNAAWDGLSTLIECGLAVIFLGQRFTDPIQYLGFIFIIIGMFCLKVPLKRKEKFVFPKIFTLLHEKFTKIKTTK